MCEGANDEHYVFALFPPNCVWCHQCNTPVQGFHPAVTVVVTVAAMPTSHGRWLVAVGGVEPASASGMRVAAQVVVGYQKIVRPTGAD